MAGNCTNNAKIDMMKINFKRVVKKGKYKWMLQYWLLLLFSNTIIIGLGALIEH